ncbi:MMPL family transporter [Kitasatospora sp. NPDC098663]|uniref:MMPL family transporter n=1 Tax=Kitasatospora sp. NPDC098663 TaxID=3364096 RepID=UPI0038167C43
MSGRLAVVALTPSGSSESHTAAGLVRAVRALPAPDDGAFAVGGPPAATADLLAALRERLPLTALCVGVSTFVLLTFAFGSVVVALKAILTTTLSLGAAFGVVTWIFQDGHLSCWLAFRPNDYIGALEPVIMLTLLFGLSIDYEVFLLSRVREHYSLTGDNEAAIVTGLRRGRVAVGQRDRSPVAIPGHRGRSCGQALLPAHGECAGPARAGFRWGRSRPRRVDAAGAAPGSIVGGTRDRGHRWTSTRVRPPPQWRTAAG